MTQGLGITSWKKSIFLCILLFLYVSQMCQFTQLYHRLHWDVDFFFPISGNFVSHVNSFAENIVSLLLEASFSIPKYFKVLLQE